MLGYLKNAGPSDLATYHAGQLGRVLRDQLGGFWMVRYSFAFPLPGEEAPGDVVTFTQHRESAGYGKSGCGVPCFDFHPVKGGAA